MTGLAVGMARAATLEISPVIVILAPGQTAATIEVRNRGGAPAAIQARAFAWTQEGDDDPLAPTLDLIVSPPIFTIPQDASQTMRILVRPHAGAPGERSYRLLLDEVPAANPGKREVVITLRVSLPVIVSAASAEPATVRTLQWQAERRPDGTTLLTAVNTGTSFDKVGAIDVTLPDGSHPHVVTDAKNAYVLPGAQRHWIVDGGANARVGPLRVSVLTQAGKSEFTLTP